MDTKVCPVCKKEFLVLSRIKNGKTLYAHCTSKSFINKKYCGRKCYLKRARSGYWTGEKANRWNGGKIDRSGYTYVKVDRKYMAEHRLIYEKNTGMKLKRGEVIHHINGNRKDNRFENLRWFPTAGMHSRIAHNLNGLNRQK